MIDMPDRIFVYIDGESHYIRTERAWRNLHGADASLECLRFTGQTNEHMPLIKPDATVFWSRKMSAGATRSVYFTSAMTDAQGLHQIRVDLRDFDLEPHVVLEKKQAFERRKNKLRDAGVIEKPKGVDIALAVRMLEDAHRDTYERCHLYTSDADFLPVIKAVMGQGKRVYVYGYKESLADQSELLHVPDLFIDLGRMLRDECELAPSK